MTVDYKEHINEKQMMNKMLLRLSRVVSHVGLD